MKANDFSFDGKRLSDINYIICDFNGGSGATEINSGSVITLNTVKKSYGKKYFLSNASYDECITATFDICKNPEYFYTNEMVVSESDYRYINRWLNRKEFLPFYFINDNDENEEETVYFNATFNISKLYYNNELYGIRCKMSTNAPYGFGAEKRYYNTFEGDDSFTIVDTSDEIGYIYPNITIYCQEAGNLVMHNALTGSHTVIKNVVDGEVITIQGEPQIITSSINNHNIANDFNYNFLSIGNTATARSNSISSNLACRIAVYYTPIIKNIY